MRVFLKLALSAVLLILLASERPLPLRVRTPSIPYHRESYHLDSGVHEGIATKTVLAFRRTVRVSEAAWLRLHFSDYHLDTQSYITIASLLDGDRQRLGATSLAQWQNSSAFFNGDAVEVKLCVAPGEGGIFFCIEEITVGEWASAAKVAPSSTGQALVLQSLGLCEGDDRVSSTDPAVGRIIPAGCTGWIVSNGAHLTAGHCPDGTGTWLDILEFNVPPSECDGTIVHPLPEDQYRIDADSIVFYADVYHKGNDWAVFDVFPNEDTGLLPVQAQGAFYRMSRDDNPSNVRVTGYGDDSDPLGCDDSYNSDNNTRQTDWGAYLGETIEGPSDVLLKFTVDAETGSSGSPVIISGTTTAIGILTGGTCNPPSSGNKGTGFENDALENAIQTFPGANVTYVDRGHPVSIEDGTVFRPFDTVAEGIAAVLSGGIISIVAGSYNEPMTITRTATLIAPVGSVVIGQ